MHVKLASVQGNIGKCVDSQLIEQHPWQQALELAHVHWSICAFLDLVPSQESRSLSEIHENVESTIEKDDNVADKGKP